MKKHSVTLLHFVNTRGEGEYVIFSGTLHPSKEEMEEYEKPGYKLKNSILFETTNDGLHQLPFDTELHPI